MTDTQQLTSIGLKTLSDPNRVKVLVTGHRGYIGSRLTMTLGNTFPWVGSDLIEDNDFADKKNGMYDAVIHLAAYVSVTESFQKPEEYMNNNCFKIIKFLRNNAVRKFVLVSTGGALYGNRHQAREVDASWSHCLSPYAQSKYLAEHVVRETVKNHTILRLANVHGGNDLGRGEAAVHGHFKRDNPIVVYGGKQTRDFIHVDTVCGAIIKSLLYDVVGTYNIGTCYETPIMDLAQHYSREREVPIEIRPARRGEVEYISLDTFEARSAGLL